MSDAMVTFLLRHNNAAGLHDDKRISDALSVTSQPWN